MQKINQNIKDTIKDAENNLKDILLVSIASFIVNIFFISSFDNNNILSSPIFCHC